MRKTWLLIIPVVLVVLWLLGPRVRFNAIDSTLPGVDINLKTAREYVLANVPDGIRKDNESKLIIYNDSVPTKYSLLYLHGFSASPKEGDPVIQDIAARYRLNSYAPLLEGHGSDDVESFAEITPAQLVSSAAEALLLASEIGEQVIIMSTSTGSTLGVELAAAHPEKVAALLNFSPNFDLADSRSNMLTGPWGLQLARLFSGGKYREWPAPDSVELYWTNRYRLEGAIAVRALLDQTMTDEKFKSLQLPVFTGYWYKNDTLCDQTISIPRIKEFDALLSTPADKKITKAYPNVGAHCMISRHWSEDIQTVEKDLFNFLENALGLQVPVTQLVEGQLQQ